jgi:hypothetical protein
MNIYKNIISSEFSMEEWMKFHGQNFMYEKLNFHGIKFIDEIKVARRDIPRSSECCHGLS